MHSAFETGGSDGIQWESIVTWLVGRAMWHKEVSLASKACFRLFSSKNFCVFTVISLLRAYVDGIYSGHHRSEDSFNEAEQQPTSKQSAMTLAPLFEEHYKCCQRNVRQNDMVEVIPDGSLVSAAPGAQQRIK